MDNTIIVNMENLTQEEREQLVNLIEKSNKPNPKKRWRAKKYTHYYSLLNSGEIWQETEGNHRNDNYRYRTGNYFKTREEAEFEREKCLVYQELKNYAIEHNEGKIDWNNAKQYKYYIYCYKGGIYIDNNNIIMCLGQIYFTSIEIARNAINTIGEDRIKKYLFGLSNMNNNK